jgi:hypothetical protein
VRNIRTYPSLRLDTPSSPVSLYVYFNLANFANFIILFHILKIDDPAAITGRVPDEPGTEDAVGVWI